MKCEFNLFSMWKGVFFLCESWSGTPPPPSAPPPPLTLRFRQMVREKLPKIRILITKRWQCQICTTKLVVRSQTDNCTCSSCENWSGCANPMDTIIQYFWCTLCEQRRYPPTHLVQRTWTVESSGRGRMKFATGSCAHIAYTNPYKKITYEC